MRMTTTPARRDALRWSLVFGVAAVGLGVLAVAGPVVWGAAAVPLVGVAAVLVGLLAGAGAVYGRKGRLGRGSVVDAAVAVVAGAGLFVSPGLVLSALAVGLAGFLAVGGVTRAVAAWRTLRGGTREGLHGDGVAAGAGVDPSGTRADAPQSVADRGGEDPSRAKARGWVWQAAGALGYLLLAGGVLVAWQGAGLVAMAAVVGVQLVLTGVGLLTAPVREEAPTAASYGLPDHPAAMATLAEVRAAEDARWAADRYWRWAIVAVFFAIHAGRTRAEWTMTGMLSPLVATVGDVMVALIVGGAIVLPGQLLWMRLTRRFERRGWAFATSCTRGMRLRLVRSWLRGRLVLAERTARAAASPLAGARRLLTLGLPATAVLIATVPLWGFSWYFNSENWVSAVWERWAEHRTEVWREGMVRAVERATPAVGEAERFAVRPAGVESGDFSFLVVGDPGEGDESQLALKDQILAAGAREEVKFLVISSDVIYPAGSMLDYERCFYLPFKGFGVGGKPVYAIPGNHDWFDALEGFNANFLEPVSARAAMASRVETDDGLTTTTAGRIDAMIAEAKRLRQQYGLSVAHQRAPFFEMHTPGFSLIAADTGVRKALDTAQAAWLERALARAEGNFTFVLLGHPFFAAGEYAVGDNAEFEALHERLRRHGAEVVMAGDTHCLEHYVEALASGRSIQHFVNGGGGAYLSIGTALGWPYPEVPSGPARGSDPRGGVRLQMTYPSRESVIAKLDEQTPAMKRPLWWWVKHADAWPSTPETMASAFSFNRAPFFQSFVEVRVERSAGVVRIVPYGVNGRLRWEDVSPLVTDDAPDPSRGAFVEWVIPLRGAR